MTYYDDIYDHAVDNYYLISTRDARRLGIPVIELVKLAKRGKLEHISHGLYRLSRYVPHQNDPYAISVASIGDDAYLYGESVIAMLDLAPTDPSRLYVATPKRYRGKNSEGLVIVIRESRNDTTTYEGVPSQEVGAAILTCLGKMMPERLYTATEEAYKEGYLTQKKRNEIMEVIKQHEASK